MYEDGQIENDHRFDAASNTWVPVIPPVKPKMSTGRKIGIGLGGAFAALFLIGLIGAVGDGADTTTSVSSGLQKSGRIITAAAVLIAIVFACFMTSGVTSIKMLSLGVSFAILLDATVVRGLLVPALMRVAGDWNWWAPKPLRKLHARFGITE